MQAGSEVVAACLTLAQSNNFYILGCDIHPRKSQPDSPYLLDHKENKIFGVLKCGGRGSLMACAGGKNSTDLRAGCMRVKGQLAL